VTSPNPKPEVKLRDIGRHLKKALRRHSSAASDPILVKCGTMTWQLR